MEVVSTFKRSGSFQGAVRRRSSVLSQLHDVNTISTPSHVALSTATANTSPAPGSEFAESMYTHLPHTHAHTRTCTRSSTDRNTCIHTAARHVDCGIFTLSGCVPSGSLAARVCAMSPLFFCFFSFLLSRWNSTQSRPAVWFWSDLDWSNPSVALRLEFVLSLSVGSCRRRLTAHSLALSLSVRGVP